MTRLWSSGFELNSMTTDVEWTAAVGGSISSSTVRSGTYAGRISSLASGTNQRFRYQFLSAGANGPYYSRFYFRIATLPSAENRIFALSNSGTAGTGVAAYITLDNTGVLRLYDNVGQIGSASSVLSTNTWYRIEILFDRSPAAGSQILKARIDGAQFAAATNRTLGNSVNQLYVGGNLNSEAQTSGDWFFDDVAINDTAGSFQTSYPGAGSIVHLKPSAAGDINTFAVQIGGTVGAGNNFTRVNEVTPDDATSYNASAVLSQEDLFNCDDPGFASDSLITLVAVGGRYADLVGTDATAAFKLQVEKAASGTKAQSASIIPNSTSFVSNSAIPRRYPITAYQDPDNIDWKFTTVSSMQIGYLLSAANVQSIAITKVWALVEYTPAPANQGKFLQLL